MAANAQTSAQTTPPTPLPAPQAVPQPGLSTDAPYVPQPILPGGVVLTLYPPGSPYLNMSRVREAEKYNLSQAAPGRVNNIVNIHNPSIEVHTVEGGLNTGAAVILAPGGGHRTLNIGGEGADFVPFFYNYGVNTIILRNRLRSDGYNPSTDETYDALQAIRLVRAHAKEWHIDPNKIGIMGFSAGAELASNTAVLYDDFDPATRLPASHRARTSWDSSIRAPRLSPMAKRRRPFRAMFRQVSSSALAPTTRSMRSGPMSTLQPCWPSMCPTSKCTSTPMAAIPAIRCVTEAT
jgi:endo-1,4-beta-xylanase